MYNIICRPTRSHFATLSSVRVMYTATYCVYRVLFVNKEEVIIFSTSMFTFAIYNYAVARPSSVEIFGNIAAYGS